MGVDDGDLECLSRQLGFVPTNVVGVVARSDNGDPTVVKLYPLTASPKALRACRTERQPFPTTYWLTCPKLKADISRLETRGLINEWQARVQGNEALLQEMEAAHKSYADDRWELLTHAQTASESLCRLGEVVITGGRAGKEDDLVVVKDNGWEAALGPGAGVAGLRRPDQIKCLHTHYAHYLGTGRRINLVGKWVDEALRLEATLFPP